MPRFQEMCIWRIPSSCLTVDDTTNVRWFDLRTLWTFAAVLTWLTSEQFCCDTHGRHSKECHSSNRKCQCVHSSCLHEFSLAWLANTLDIGCSLDTNRKSFLAGKTVGVHGGVSSTERRISAFGLPINRNTLSTQLFHWFDLHTFWIPALDYWAHNYKSIMFSTFFIRGALDHQEQILKIEVSDGH